MEIIELGIAARDRHETDHAHTEKYSSDDPQRTLTGWGGQGYSN